MEGMYLKSLPTKKEAVASDVESQSHLAVAGGSISYTFQHDRGMISRGFPQLIDPPATARWY
jgi:hypothetical protein